MLQTTSEHTTKNWYDTSVPPQDSRLYEAYVHSRGATLARRQFPVPLFRRLFAPLAVRPPAQRHTRILGSIGTLEHNVARDRVKGELARFRGLLPPAAAAQVAVLEFSAHQEWLEALNATTWSVVARRSGCTSPLAHCLGFGGKEAMALSQLHCS